MRIWNTYGLSYNFVKNSLYIIGGLTLLLSEKLVSDGKNTFFFIEMILLFFLKQHIKATLKLSQVYIFSILTLFLLANYPLKELTGDILFKDHLFFDTVCLALLITIFISKFNRKTLFSLLCVQFSVVSGLILYFENKMHLAVLAFIFLGVHLSKFLEYFLCKSEDKGRTDYRLFDALIISYITQEIIFKSNDSVLSNVQLNNPVILVFLYPLIVFSELLIIKLFYHRPKVRIFLLRKTLLLVNNLQHCKNTFIISTISIIVIIVSNYLKNPFPITVIGIISVVFKFHDKWFYKSYQGILRDKIYGKKIITPLICLYFLTSCSGAKDIIYLQGSADTYKDVSTCITIEPNDILSIKIISADQELSKLYNQAPYELNGVNNFETIKLASYLVDKDEQITFPFLGKISTTGKSTSDLEQFIKIKLIESKQLSDCEVIVKIINSKFTVLGEVKTPGTYSFSESKLSIFQALGYAGDLTIQASRKNITLIRTENDSKKILHFDLTSAEIMDSEASFILKNDVLIINPNKAKIKSAGIIGNPATLLSIASLVLSSLILLKK